MKKLTVRQQQALALISPISPRGGHRVLTTTKGGPPTWVGHLRCPLIHQATIDALVERGEIRILGQQGMALLVVRAR